jgi:uncharacterized protein
MTMKTAIKNEISDIAKKITEKLKVSKIIIFGSQVYGKPSKDSDIDMCVIIDENRRRIDVAREIRREIIAESKSPLDIFVFRKDEFEDKAKNSDGMEREINEKGLVIYG